MHIRHCIFHELPQGKNAEKTCESICNFLAGDIVSYDECAFCFKRFENRRLLFDRQAERSESSRKCDHDDFKSNY